MAFLDNSGDILLDAVLTDIGRKRMADGTFIISKFALGDDDINYQLYNKNHPSGSAYYDLEILQSPVREATTKAGNIHYGLLDNTNLQLLYLPSIKANPGSATGRPSVWTAPFNYTATGAGYAPVTQLINGIYWMAANSATKLLLDANSSGGTVNTSTAAALSGYSGATTNNFILFETGIDSDLVTADSSNRTSYLTNQGLMDTTFTISADVKFISSVAGIQGSSTVTNGDVDASPETCTPNLSWGAYTSGAPSTTVASYYDYAVAAGSDQITYNSKYTVIKGPRGTFGALQFNIPNPLQSTTTTDTAYYNYGKVNQDMGFGDGKTYDYIDTTVYVRGDASGVTLQLPIRIIRQNS